LGFGQEKYVLVGQSHFGPTVPPGFMRLAVGRSPAGQVIDFLKKVMVG